MESSTVLDYETILLKDPLFTKYSLINVEQEVLINLLFNKDNNIKYSRLKTIDSYCTICKKKTTFNVESSSREDVDELQRMLLIASNFGTGREASALKLIEQLESSCIFIRKFNCPRHPSDSSHSQVFIFRIIGTSLVKVGQHPPLADLLSEEIKKYRKLNNEVYSELNRAVGLSTHGVGIGAFVYLRRIIEKHIVYPKIQELIVTGRHTNEEISKLDFKGKIKLAKDTLPDFLVSNTKIYSILSKGIHELNEEECKKSFPILRQAIEMILDQQIEQKEQEEKRKKISDALNKF